MPEEFDIKKDIEESHYRMSILEALLVSSVSEDALRFPTMKEYILSEVINGTIEYIGGDAGKMIYQGRRYYRNTFEKEIYGYLESQMKINADGKLNSQIKAVIDKLCKCYYTNPAGPDRPYLHTKLYNHFKGFAGGGICPVIMESSFSLPQDLVIRVQKEILPRLSSPEKRDVEGIGKAMRKYIESDLKFITGYRAKDIAARFTPLRGKST